jgi:hypothetical protein
MICSAAVPVRCALLRADPVDRPPVRDRRHPRHRAAPSRLEPRCTPPDVQQHLLTDLLGLEPIAYRGAHHTEHGRNHLSAQNLERCLVTMRYLGKQILRVCTARSRRAFRGAWQGSPAAVTNAHNANSPLARLPIARCEICGT